MGDFQNYFPSGRSTILLRRSCSRFRDINQFGDSHGACCFLSTHFCALALYFIGHPCSQPKEYNGLVSQLQRRKKIVRSYSDIINKVNVDC